MTEVSHSEVPALSFDAFRGRAIHIHDEMLYADASAYYAMNALWDLTSHRDHFKGRGGDHPDALFTEQDTVVLVDNDKPAVHITGMGYAIGHYARWVRRGAVRIDAESSDPLVQVTAFRDDADKRLVLVVINNARESQRLLISAKSFSLAGRITGEQSTAHVFWKALAASRGRTAGCRASGSPWLECHELGRAGVDHAVSGPSYRPPGFDSRVDLRK